jgi:hypothetical protein
MAGKYRERLTFSNVVSVISLLFALGLGSAWAATELEKNEVKSKHIGKGQVKNPDLADNAVTSPKVADGSLLGADFAPDQLPAGERGPVGPPGQPGADGADGADGSPDTPQQVLDKIKQVDGSGSGLDAATVGGIPTSELGTLGRNGFPNTICTDDDEDFEDCASVTLNLPRAGRVLLTASNYAFVQLLDDNTGPGSTTDGPGVGGLCRFRTDGLFTPAPGTQSSMSQVGGVDASGLTAVTDPLPQGSHTFALSCLEVDGDINWGESSISAVMLGNG